MNVGSWVLWAFLLILQNFAFTFVSRARSSGSLKRHVVAAFFSNGVWFVSQVIIFTTIFAMIKGDYGIAKSIFAGIYYTIFTITGSVLAHYWALKTEKGKSAVGANKLYAQITTKEWELVKEKLDIKNNG